MGRKPKILLAERIHMRKCDRTVGLRGGERPGNLGEILGAGSKKHDRFGRKDWKHAPMLPMTEATKGHLYWVASYVEASPCVFERVVARLVEEMLKKFASAKEVAKTIVKPSDVVFRQTHPIIPRIPMSDKTCRFFIDVSHELGKQGEVAPMVIAGLLIEKFIEETGSPQKMAAILMGVKLPS